MSSGAVQVTVTSAVGSMRRCRVARATTQPRPGDHATEERCPTSCSPSGVDTRAPTEGRHHGGVVGCGPSGAVTTTPQRCRATLEPRASSRATSSWPVKQPLVNETVRSTRADFGGDGPFLDLPAVDRHAGFDPGRLPRRLGAPAPPGRPPPRRRGHRRPRDRAGPDPVSPGHSHREDQGRVHRMTVARGLGAPDGHTGPREGLELHLDPEPEPLQPGDHGRAEPGIGVEDELIVGPAG